MKQKIKRLLLLLQLEYALMWTLIILSFVLFECDILPQGVFVGDARADYVMQTAGILLAISMIPFSLRMFSLSLTRYVRQQSLPDALVSYRRWSEVRLAMLLASALFNTTAYYTTMNISGLLCAGMVLVASLFCIPNHRRLLKELDLEQD